MAKKKKKLAKKTKKKPSKTKKKVNVKSKKASSAKKKASKAVKKKKKVAVKKKKAKVAKKKTVAVKKKKAKVAPKKSPASKKAAKKAAPKKAEKKEAPKKAPPVKTKGEIPLQNPLKFFLEIWKPKSESFFAGIQKLFTEYSIPGSTEAVQEKNQMSILEKIQSSMRKEPISKDIEEQLAQRYPKDRIHKMASIFSMKPRLSIRLNTLKADINGFASSLAAKDLKLKRGAYSPWSFEVGADNDPQNHAVFERGLIEIQPEASQLSAVLLNPRPGQRILDLCAREGDNTLAIAGMMKNKGSLFVYDSDPQNLKTVKARTQKTGVENTRLISGNQITELKSLDGVLIDAPCTNLGMLAHHPDVKWRFRKEELPKIQKLQAALLREGARKLKLGGHLVYMTSTLNRSENEDQIEHFLRTSHNSFRLVSIKQYLKEFSVPYLRNFYGFEWDPQSFESFTESDPYFVLSPDVHGTYGMFAAVIERTRISG